MRLWHYKLLPYLPKSQLIAQWRELNSIFKKQDNHILINYVYEYPVLDLKVYTRKVLVEMKKRNIKIKSHKNLEIYFNQNIIVCMNEALKAYDYDPFKNHHNSRYLKQCFYNLQEKYDRGQKDFDKNTYELLYKFYLLEITKEEIENGIKETN